MLWNGSTSGRWFDHCLFVFGICITVHSHHWNLPFLHYVSTLVAVQFKDSRMFHNSTRNDIYIRQGNKKFSGIRLLYCCTNNFTLAITKSNPYSILLAVTSHRNDISIFNKTSWTQTCLNRLSSVPGQL